VNAATNTVVFNLITPDSEFLDQLAVPFGSIVPGGTPAKDQGDTPVPGTGAYEFTSYNPNSALIMKRNPYFKVWSAAAQPQGYPNEIEMTFGSPVESEVTAVENGSGRLDLRPDPGRPTLGDLDEVREQVHVHTLTADWYAPMNVNIAPFNNLKARQAVNYAIEQELARGALRRQGTGHADVHDPAAGLPRVHEVLRVQLQQFSRPTPDRTSRRRRRS
jgi:peptide/nickel transport system substrate-binding protein